MLKAKLLKMLGYEVVLVQFGYSFKVRRVRHTSTDGTKFVKVCNGIYPLYNSGPSGRGFDACKWAPL
jgi:hypothetical protein